MKSGKSGRQQDRGIRDESGKYNYRSVFSLHFWVARLFEIGCFL